MSGSLSVKVNAETYKWQGVEWRFWSLAPSFRHRLVAVAGCPRTFVWLYNAERDEFLRALVSPASPYVNAVHEVVNRHGVAA